MIRIADLKIPLEYDSKMLEVIVAERLRIECSRIEKIKIIKRSVNSRNKSDIYFDMTIVVSITGDENEVIYQNRHNNINQEIELNYIVPKNKRCKERPVVVGFGPAGMFAALILAQAGARPIVLERGADVDSRRLSVNKFWKTGELDINSNVQFGEGGAGTFSDGKLKIGAIDLRKAKILSEFVAAGAPPEIMYLSKPHIGTDRLHETVKTLRKKIIELGGEVRFNSKLTGIQRKDGKVTGVGFLENGLYNELTTYNVVLAIGHSARDTFEQLLNSGIFMEQKPFAVGVRIEHPQDLINTIEYGKFAGNSALGAADYRMVVHLPNGRNVYTFCMCPGGTVVAATSEENAVVTNGMSEFKRDGRNANCALFVTIEKKDFGSADALAGVALQRKIESAAFAAGGCGYKAPIQRLEDFLHNKKTKSFGDVLPTYRPGTEFATVDSYMPHYIVDSLRKGIIEMGEWMPGYSYPDALLTGAETRSSSPVRITRDDSYNAVGVKGLYPCGEGAGYGGGILSSAVDGIKCAEHILG
ncbi:MAG: hypothetical protein PHV07_05195 [Oscillospiraceae bacterium]|nr:hypothetical protein [Oscillospiraceae bacterium]